MQYSLLSGNIARFFNKRLFRAVVFGNAVQPYTTTIKKPYRVAPAGFLMIITLKTILKIFN
jgi:hypothetical protein